MVLGSSSMCSGSRTSSKRDILEVPWARALSATRGSFCTTCNGQLGTGGGPGLLLHLLQKQPPTIDSHLGTQLFYDTTNYNWTHPILFVISSKCRYIGGGRKKSCVPPV